MLIVGLARLMRGSGRIVVGFWFWFLGWSYLKERYYGEVLKKKSQVERAS